MNSVLFHCRLSQKHFSVISIEDKPKTAIKLVVEPLDSSDVTTESTPAVHSQVPPDSSVVG